MKVLLLNPPSPQGVMMVREGRCMQRGGAWTAVWTPLSLALIGAILEKEKFDVKLYDCIVEKIDFNQVKKIIKNYEPNLIVINTATPSIETDLLVAKIAKKIDPKIINIAIGIHVSALPNESLRMQLNLDFIARGEPEFTVKELALKMRDKKSLSKIKGTSYLKKGKVIHNKDREPIKNLDELPFPAWHLIKSQHYTMPFTGKRFLLIATARGCPYRCLFCADHAYYGRKLRKRSPKNIVDEMERNWKEYRINNYLVWSESFTIDNQFTVNVCKEIIKRGIKVEWVANGRVDHVNLNSLKLMKKAGCFMIGYGIESATQKILDNMNKGTTIQQAIKAVEDTKKAGIEVVGHFVLGMLGETRETIQDTVNFAKKLDLDYAQFYCFVPFPGSEIYNTALRNNWIVNKNWSMFEQNFSVVNLKNIKAKEVMELRHKAYKQFYFRPRMIFKTLKKVRSLRQFGIFLKRVYDFLGWM